MTRDKKEFIEAMLTWFRSPKVGNDEELDRKFLASAYDNITQPHWISVNDELPNEDGMYIFLQSGIIYTAMHYKSIGLHRDITHWMPLPSVERLRETTKMIEKGGEE